MKKRIRKWLIFIIFLISLLPTHLLSRVYTPFGFQILYGILAYSTEGHDVGYFFAQLFFSYFYVLFFNIILLKNPDVILITTYRVGLILLFFADLARLYILFGYSFALSYFFDFLVFWYFPIIIFIAIVIEGIIYFNNKRNNITG